MPSHPAAPVELSDLVSGFEHGLRAVIDLAMTISAEDAATVTSCPGWSVQDHLAHLADVESALDGGEHVEIELPEQDAYRLHRDFPRWLEHGVQRRRGRSVPEVVAELEVLLHNRTATLSNPELTLETEVPAPVDRVVPLGELLRRRVIDVWVHEQDIREALGRPGNLDTAGAATFVDTVVHTFPSVVATRVAPPAGHSIILESTGPVTARTGVRLNHGAEDGDEVVAHALFSGDAGQAEGDHATQAEHPEDDVVVTSISLSTDALTRRAAGRRATADTAYRVADGGDEELAARVLDALVITP